MERLVNVVCQVPTDWGKLVVVESASVQGILAKVVAVPTPAIIIGETKLAPAGVAIPSRRGKVPGEPFGLAEGTKVDVIEWKNIVNGGGSIMDRKQLIQNGITSKPIPVKYDPDGYCNLLKGCGFLAGKPVRF